MEFPAHAALPLAIRWGIIGCGSVCEVKSGPAFYKVPNSRLVAVMRRDAAKAEDFAKRHHVPRWYTSAADLLADQELDAVYIATPPSTHLHYALQVCAAGKPCYVEKPMGRTHAECRQMAEAFQAARLPLYVGYYRRGLPKFRRVKAAIEDKAIGTITGVSMKLRQARHKQEVGGDYWRLTAETSGGGLFLDLGSHQLDLLDYLLGPIEDVQAAVSRSNVRAAHEMGDPVEDNIRMIFRQGAVQGIAEWNFGADLWEDQVDIVGAEGTITFACFDHEPAVIRRGNASEVVLEVPQPEHVHFQLVDAVTRDLLLWKADPEEYLTVGADCPSTAESAARTNAVIDQMLNTYYGGREDDFWNHPERWQHGK